MTIDELLIVRAHEAGPIRLRDGRVLHGTVTGYDGDAPGGPTVEVTPTDGEPLVIRLDEIDPK